jgi:hypothetical protein
MRLGKPSAGYQKGIHGKAVAGDLHDLSSCAMHERQVERRFILAKGTAVW